MKKVALAVSMDGKLAHFGHCDQFVIYDIDSSNITNQTTLINPEHSPGFLPKFLYDHGINTVIAENLGAMALNILQSLKMEVFFGVNGEEKDAIEKYINGELKGSDKAPDHHHDHSNHTHDKEHHHSCHGSEN